MDHNKTSVERIDHAAFGRGGLHLAAAEAEAALLTPCVRGAGVFNLLSRLVAGRIKITDSYLDTYCLWQGLIL